MPFFAGMIQRGIFTNATINTDGRRYATLNGIAFEAKSSADGTWHGFPIPWEDVPADIKDNWHDQKFVSKSDLKRYMTFPKGNIEWALETDHD